MSIILNKKFYKLSAVKKTISAYRDLGSFKIKKRVKNYMVILDEINSEAKETIEDEFSNYVLATMKNE